MAHDLYTPKWFDEDLDDDPGAAPANPIDDDLWIPPGVQRLPASRLVFTDVDDYAPLGGLRVDEDYWQRPQSSIPANQQPLVLDDDSRVQITTVVDEDEWRAQSRVVLPVAQQLWFDEAEASPLGGLRVEEEFWWPVQTWQPVRNRQPYLDTDEDNAGKLGGLRIEDEYWVWPGVQWLPSSRLVHTDVEDYEPLGGFRVDEDYWIQPQLIPLGSNRQLPKDLEELGVAPVQEVSQSGSVRFIVKRRVPRTQLFEGRDDELSFVVVTIVDEDLWIPPGVQILPGSHVVSQATDEDSTSPLGGFRIDEEYLWTSQFTLYTNKQPASDTDELSFIRVEDEYWIKPSVISLPASSRVFTDENDSWPLGGLRVEDEVWLPVSSQPLQTIQPPLRDSDELPIVVTALDEDSWTTKTQLVASIPVVYTDTEEGAPLGGFRLEDESWTTAKPQVAPAPSRVWIDQDELATAQVTAVDEDSWQQLRYIPFTVNRQPLVDTEEFAAPVQEVGPSGAVRLVIRRPARRVHVFTDTDELAVAPANRFDEDYWQQPRFVPLTPNKQPITEADELAITLVAFGLEDSDQWMVPGTCVVRTTVYKPPMVAVGDEGDRVPAVAVAETSIYIPTFRPRRR